VELKSEKNSIYPGWRQDKIDKKGQKKGQVLFSWKNSQKGDPLKRRRREKGK